MKRQSHTQDFSAAVTSAEQGFSIIDTLMVVAIISILAAVGAPGHGQRGDRSSAS